MRAWIFSILFCLLLAGCSQKQYPPIVLEEHATVSATLDDKLPHLPPLVTTPLTCEAVGIEDVLGKFQPIMYMAQPTPRFGGSSSFMQPGSRATFKVYLGVHEVAASNKFLGEFEIIRADDATQPLEAMIGFKVIDQQLLLAVTDPTGQQTMNVRRVDGFARQ